jgi:Sec-independent protein translocase protein TatA
VLNLGWNEIAFVGFLFLLVFFVGYLSRLGDAIGDFLHGYRAAAGGRPAEPAQPETKDKAGSKRDPAS